MVRIGIVGFGKIFSKIWKTSTLCQYRELGIVVKFSITRSKTDVGNAGIAAIILFFFNLRAIPDLILNKQTQK